MTFWQIANDLSAHGTPFVVVTLASSNGHVPQEEGAKAIVTGDGLRWGTVGGGKVEARAIDLARKFLADENHKRHELVTWNLQRDIGMTCGGEASFLFEKYAEPAWQIAVFGAGHVAQALVRVLGNLDCLVTCLDPRPEWIAKLPDSGKIRSVISEKPESEINRFGKNTFFVVMTKGHQTDMPILRSIFRLFPDAPYVGVMGSDVKAAKIRNELLEAGVSETHLAKLKSPIGFRVGGNRPEEIAISVACQLLEARDQCT